MYKFVHLSKLS